MVAAGFSLRHQLIAKWYEKQTLFQKVFRRVRLMHHELTAAAGTEARPTHLFMVYGWAKGP
jgi:hypothetical protein